MDEGTAIVVDNGSVWTTAGYNGEDSYRTRFATLFGTWKSSTQRFMTFGEHKKHYLGDEALTRRGFLNLTHPVKNGIITDFKKMDDLWWHTFYTELRVQPEKRPVLITESPMNPKQNREKTTQILFESFNIPQLYLANRAVMSLYASGKTTGVIVDAGEHEHRFVPVVDGHTILPATKTVDFGGKNLTELFKKIVNELGHGIHGTGADELLNDIKEKLCYVALDYDQELLRETSGSYELPDGNLLTFGNVRFECLEALFKPKFDKQGEGIHEALYNSIRICDQNLQKQLFSNITLAGGTSMFRGLSQRLTKELSILAPGATINVDAPPERKHSAWMGGSMWCCVNNIDQWMTKELYDEYGVDIVHRKCPQTSYIAEASVGTKNMYNQQGFNDVTIL
jgi:actin-related protein